MKSSDMCWPIHSGSEGLVTSLEAEAAAALGAGLTGPRLEDRMATRIDLLPRLMLFVARFGP